MAVPVLTELGIDQEVIDLINQERAKVGANPITKNEMIDDSSDRHALDMATNNNLSETGSDGSTVASRAKDANLNFPSVTETIAAGPMTPTEVVAQWIDNPTDRNKLLDPGATHILHQCIDTRFGSRLILTPAPEKPAVLVYSLFLSVIS